ncbi:response regulator [Bifidobacterium psychraerophilum]|jgi:two-component system KDP operon response regulator KdpE|uniref:response regulator transcription factor n=1 Tax=Bifidobacterium TaxID=1678 RepID=UPI002F35DF8C|nr:response regulator transcription factor [Bifidobacterium crudilactis]
MKILIADDDPQLLKALRITLRSQGYEIITAQDGESGIRKAIDERPDLFILDIGMPGLNGIEVIQAVRGWNAAPILVLSGRADAREKVRALDAGADGYVTKPVSIDELLAYVRALGRRSAARNEDETDPVVRIGKVTIDFSARSVTLSEHQQGPEVRFTPTEWKILDMLFRNHGRLVTRQDMLTQIWGSEHVSDSGYLRLYISQLRKKIEVDPTHPEFLKTEPGMGYRLDI